MQEQRLKYLVDKLEYQKKMTDLASTNKINRVKMMQEKAKFDGKKSEMVDNMQAKGMLGYQTTNPNDGYNYPLIDTFAKMNK